MPEARIKLVCPECQSDDIDIYDSEENIDEGKITYKCYCYEENCGVSFFAHCTLTIDSIEPFKDE